MNNTKTIQLEIQNLVDRETKAWDTQNVELLMTLFHPDMVWPWPPDPKAHDPVTWLLEQGKYDYDRWSTGWQQLFDTHDLIHNRRETKKIVVSKEGDGAFAVVDIDTLWKQKKSDSSMHWKGRVCKIYTKVEDNWLMISHIGTLDYSLVPN